MPYTIQDIAAIIAPGSSLPDPAAIIDHLLIDSRRLVFPAATLFFALHSPRRNGEDFIENLYSQGVRSFVVSDSFDAVPYPGANFLLAANPLHALQQLAAFHRAKFSIPVIGITGSNGKTIVKEWLYQLLAPDYTIVRSPKSYNSQIGVPLSVWQMNESHTLAIFEAGISEPGEMAALEAIIQPTVGVLTNVRVAHAASFASKEEKFREKWKLFKNCDIVICSNLDLSTRFEIAKEPPEKIFNWGDSLANLSITEVSKQEGSSLICADYLSEPITVTVPFTDNASIENVITCWALLLFLQVPQPVIADRMQHLEALEMRLQLKKVSNNCSLINDSYSNDISSLRMALDFLHQQSGNQSTTVILSDLGEVNSTDEQYEKILQALTFHKVDKFIGIGPRLQALQTTFAAALPNTFFFASVADFTRQFARLRFRDEVILLKGARSFEFEQINLLFEQKMHQTVLEVNLTAMAHNLKQYQQILQPDTKVMAMVKAFSYGSGSAEVASVLQFHQVDYLAVAYADEGVELRLAGIHMPIMVLNPETITFPTLVAHNLEPEMYSFSILHAFNTYLDKEAIPQFPVHIKIDTGMHRLGFEAGDLAALAGFLAANTRLAVKSVFSHFAGSEDAVHDVFTQQQATLFEQACIAIKSAVGYSFIEHIANSAAIFRHPQFQLGMVRLGIGLYGVDSSAAGKLTLLPVATLRSTVAQIRAVKQGETVGYSRKGLVTRDSRIATIRIGYADGFSRRLGNGRGHVYVKGKLAPVVGSVCMDMTMIDITDIENVAEGDVVEIFGANLPVQQVAAWCDTITYEIMTGISQRVKREYYEE